MKSCYRRTSLDYRMLKVSYKVAKKYAIDLKKFFGLLLNSDLRHTKPSIRNIKGVFMSSISSSTTVSSSGTTALSSVTKSVSVKGFFGRIFSRKSTTETNKLFATKEFEKDLTKKLASLKKKSEVSSNGSSSTSSASTSSSSTSSSSTSSASKSLSQLNSGIRSPSSALAGQVAQTKFPVMRGRSSSVPVRPIGCSELYSPPVEKDGRSFKELCDDAASHLYQKEVHQAKKLYQKACLLVESAKDGNVDMGDILPQEPFVALAGLLKDDETVFHCFLRGAGVSGFKCQLGLGHYYLHTIKEHASSTTQVQFQQKKAKEWYEKAIQAANPYLEKRKGKIRQEAEDCIATAQEKLKELG